jgi:hypothetical protein
MAAPAAATETEVVGAASSSYFAGFFYFFGWSGGGGGASGGGGGGVPTNTKGNGVTYRNLTGTGQNVDDIKGTLNLLEVNIDDKCAQWLETNSDISLNDKIDQLKIGVADGFFVNGSSNPNIAAVARDVGYSIIFNLTGAYFNSNLKQEFNILIHEIAHLVGAPDFNNNDGGTDADGNPTQAAKDAQAHNQELIDLNCGRTIH